MQGKSEREKGIIAIILLALTIAPLGALARFLNAEFTILQQVYLRVIMAFLIGLIVFYKDLHFEKLKKIDKKEWLLLVFRSVTMYLVGVTLFSKAYVLAKFSNVSFIQTIPFVAVLGFLFLKEKVTFRKIIYILLSFLGVILIAVKDYSHLFEWGVGEVLSLVSVIGFAFSYITRKWHKNLLNNQELVILMFFLSAIILIFTSLVFGEVLPPPSTWPFTISLALLAAGVLNVINVFLVNYGFQKIEAVLANNLLMLQALFAVILGFALYGELPLLKELIGGVFIILSAYKINKLGTVNK